MQTYCQPSTDISQCPQPAAATPFPSRKQATFWDKFFRFAGQIPVDHTYLERLDLIEARQAAKQTTRCDCG